MTRKADDVERIRKLVDDVGHAPESVNLHDLKRDLDRFSESLRSDDLSARDWPIRALAQKKELNQLARCADGILASFETESLRYRNIPNDFCIIEKDKLLLQLRLLAHWARKEKSSIEVRGRRALGYLNRPDSKICYSLAAIYERHFKRRAGASEIAGKAAGPFVRFALYALNEHDAGSERPKIAAGTVKRAWSEAKRDYSFDVATGDITIKGNFDVATGAVNILQPRQRTSSRRHGARKRD
jgi:hypothetical protein